MRLALVLVPASAKKGKVFMKKRIISFILAVALVFGVLSMSSCYFIGDKLGSLGSLGTGTSGGDTEINVNGGDNYDITINSDASSDILAASKALLSSVSVICQFTKYSGLPMGNAGSGESYASAGSGVIYQLDKENGNAYIITNYHVVYDSDANTSNHISNKINVYLYGQEYSDYAIDATYVGGSMLYDLAVLEVKNSVTLMKSAAVAADIADSNKVSVLETAIAIGNPESHGISATVGHINVDSEYITMTASDSKTSVELRVIRTDAAVNHGNSGGGLFNRKGELIGIVNAKMADDSIDNIGYAIPSNVAKAIADNILYYCKDGTRECVVRVIMGITVKTSEAYTEYDKETGKIYKRERISVDSIEATSEVGAYLNIGDVINSITIDGVKYDVSRLFHVVDSMLNARAGSVVVMNVTRSGEVIEVTVPITASMLTEYK